MFKFVVLFAVFGYLSAVELDRLNIQEGKENFDENIMIDKQKGISTFHTGKHCGRKGVTEMVDAEHGIVANKFDKEDNDRLEKVCVIRAFNPETDPTPSRASRGLKLSGNKMPSKVVEVEHMYLLELYEGEVSKEIQSFCAGRPIMIQTNVPDLKAAAVEAVKQAKASKKNARKRAVLREFTACTNASTMKIMTCPGDKLRAECKIRRASCTYWINCPMNLQKGGFDCKGLHKFNSMICCDYNC